MRDLGLAHVLAIKVPDAGGERIIISNDVFKLQDFGNYFASYAQSWMAEYSISP